MPQQKKRYFDNISIWLVIGMSVILSITVLVLAFMNHNREKQFMVEFLNDKGASLIRAFEAGARTGMMGGFGTLARLETLIQETAVQPDILYIAIIDPNGEIIAHSEPEQLGQTFLDKNAMTALEADKEVKWRTVTNTSLSAFEVYKLFLPVLPSQPQSHMMQMMQNRWQMMQSRMGGGHGSEWTKGLQSEKLFHPDNRPVIVIGMDTVSFEEAMAEDVKLMILISSILILLGIGGVVSLFWAQNYTRSKKLLSNISAISSEMISNLPEGIILTDNDLKIHYMNDIAGKLFDTNINEAIGRSSQDILPPAVNSMQMTTDKSNKVIETELIFYTGSGREIPVSVVGTEVVTDDGFFVGRMYLIKDLTQIKQLQAEIQRKDKMAAIGDLAAGVAHEVRNPLSSIKGYASYFKSLFKDDPKNSEAAEVLINETDRLNRVITELLEISRPSDIKPKSVDIQSIFDTTLRLIQPDSTQQTKPDILLEIEDGIETIYIDPDRFVQVLMNIYLNSIQAMPDGGLLKTEVTSNKDSIKITITDTGCGMSLETRNQLFNPYFTTKKTGTGLGMAIVMKIIEAHKGDITVSSDEGKGTEITIHLPKDKGLILS
jgi:two-component system sensor histidine kinase HydH